MIITIIVVLMNNKEEIHSFIHPFINFYLT